MESELVDALEDMLWQYGIMFMSCDEHACSVLAEYYETDFDNVQRYYLKGGKILKEKPNLLTSGDYKSKEWKNWKRRLERHGSLAEWIKRK